MALGKLVEAIESDFRRSRQNVNLKERFLQEKKSEAAELRKASAIQEDQIRVIKNQNEQNASTVEILIEDINLRRAHSFRHEQHVDILVQRNRSLENEFKKKDEKFQMEFRGTEDLLQIQLNRYQTLPNAKTLTKMEQELLRLQNLIKVLTMKEDNAAQGFTRNELQDSTMEDTSTFRDFCVGLAETLVERWRYSGNSELLQPLVRENTRSPEQNPHQLDSYPCGVPEEVVGSAMEVDGGNVAASALQLENETLSLHQKDLTNATASDTPEFYSKTADLTETAVRSHDEDLEHESDAERNIAVSTMETSSLDVEMNDVPVFNLVEVEIISSGPSTEIPSGIGRTDSEHIESAEKRGISLSRGLNAGTVFKAGMHSASASSSNFLSFTSATSKPSPGPNASHFTPVAALKPFKIPLRPVEKATPVRAVGLAAVPSFFAQPDSPLQTMDAQEFTGFDLFDKLSPTSPHEKDKALAGPFGGFFSAAGAGGQGALSPRSDDSSDGDSMFGNYGGSNQQGTSSKFNSGFKLNF